MTSFNAKIRQLCFLVLLIGLAVLLFRELYAFFPGFLGALTLYLLTRRLFLELTAKRRWNKSLTTILFITVFTGCIVVPVFFSLRAIYRKAEVLFQNPGGLLNALNSVSALMKKVTGQELLTEDLTKQISAKMMDMVPMLLNGSLMLLTNLVMMLFLAYFMLKNGTKMEAAMTRHIPLKKENLRSLCDETVMMVRTNAVGIPLISIIQGLFALAGYWIFGISDFVLLGFVTGIFAFFPLVGTAVVWLPLVLYLFSVGDTGKAVGLGIYSLIVTGNVDYLARVTFLKQMGNVHPVVTVLGLIAGLKLLGFWGFIFGPLLISGLLLLFRIYKSEFFPRNGSEHPGKPRPVRRSAARAAEESRVW